MSTVIFYLYTGVMLYLIWSLLPSTGYVNFQDLFEIVDHLSPEGEKKNQSNQNKLSV